MEEKENLYINPEDKNEVLEAEEYADEEELGGHKEPLAANAAALQRQSQIKIDTKTFEITKFLTKDGKQGKKIKAKKSDFIHNFIHLFGEKFDFTGRNYLLPIYNAGYKNILLCTGRQVEKSTMISNTCVIDSVIQPYYKMLYVSPSHMQSRQFSSDRLKPAREQSPLINKYFLSTQVSNQVFEKGYTNGSMTFLRSAFLNADRVRGLSADTLCITGDQSIFMSDGSISLVKDLVSSGAIGKKILTLNEKTYGVEYDEITNISISKPNKKIIKINSKSGQSISCTEDHKILTWNGWKEAKDITTDDYIVEARNVPFTEDNKNTLDEDMSFLCACLLGDGTHKHFKAVRFSSCNDEMVQAFINKLSKFTKEFTVNKYEHKSSLATNKRLAIETVVNIYGRESGIKPKLRDLGVIGQKTINKNISFLKYIDTKEKALAAINGFFMTDGYICTSKRLRDIGKGFTISVECGYVTTSKILAQEISILLRKVGVYSSIRTRKPTNGVTKKIQYIVQVRDIDNFERLINLLDVPGKSDAIAKGKYAISECTANRKSNLYPVTNKQAIKILQKNGKSLHGYRSDMTANLSNTDNLVGWKKLRKIAEYTKDKELLRKTNEDIVFQKVLSVESEIDHECVYDFTMKKNHNFFVNGILVHNCLDEIQDLIMQNVPVIEEVLSHSKHGYKLYTGTPKSFDNTIQQYWERSSQNEWLVPCHRHDPVHWNYLNEKSLGLTGLICNKCGSPIHASEGRWFRTSSKDEFQGFRISQLMVPWYTAVPEKWKGLLIKFETYPKAQFNNEVLGLSYDSATKPISKGEIMSCCSDVHGILKVPNQTIRGYANFAGVDWGEGSDGSEKNANGKYKNASYTILTIGTYLGTQFFPYFIRKFEGAEANPTYVEQEIIRTCKAYNVIQIGVDWGHGWGMNERLENAFGKQRVIKFMHTGNLKQRRKYEAVGNRYHLSRNVMITEIFELIKKKKILFPRWNEFEVFAQDLLNVYTEYNEYSRTMKYDHRADQPDDFLHSLIYCHEAANIYYGLGG